VGKRASHFPGPTLDVTLARHCARIALGNRTLVNTPMSITRSNHMAALGDTFRTECDIRDCEVEGEIPAGLDASQLMERRSDLVARSAVRRYTSATSLKGAGLAQRAESPDKEPAREDETEPWSRGRAATRVGRAVHATLQSLPLSADDASIASYSRAQAVAEAVPHLASRIEDLVRWIVKESTAWQRAKAAPRALREVPFALVRDGDVIEGFIDMVLENPDGLEIIDWKTDGVTPGEVPDRLQEYKLQAGLYVHGLRAATGLPISGVTYVFASARAEASPGAPDELALEALGILAASTA